ncbi:hypothetical protein IFM89_012065 [Coptis chinensis]|uniref:RNase H type-1 domain-containing protein n=1 Tax=Coptis chinensis TaxID=261450 RepID=A0A835I2I0_9MAGN|nr:hypothetical protein IFM89_012065 [Coptis chinensis]
MIAMMVTSDPYGHPWILSCFYGSPYPNLKRHSWEFLHTLSDDYALPWVIIGDLNMILGKSEKRGGDLYTPNESVIANNLIQEAGLIDIGFSGNPFTWWNKQAGLGSVKKCLDRSLANAEWLLIFPEANLIHIPTISSDHIAILLDTLPQTHTLSHPFHFQAMWIRDDTYPKVITSMWRQSHFTNTASHLGYNLNKTKKALKIWNKNHFGQTINYEKSGVHFSANLNHSHKDSIRRILGMNIISSSDKYHGCPLFLGKTKVQMFDSLIPKVESRIDGWKTGTWTRHATTAEEVECRGVLLATQWALERQLTHLELEIDAQAITVEWATRSSNLSWRSKDIIRDIISLASNFVYFDIIFCSRNINGIADLISKKTVALGESFLWEDPLPQWLMDAVEKDRTSIPICIGSII